MYVEAQFKNVDNVRVDITLTQTLKEWRELAVQLDQKRWPSNELYNVISNVISQLNEKMCALSKPKVTPGEQAL